ncbi:hypothetical protein AB4Y72_14055 [Arthrobacter sp. YAF34]|uniref:hypothetical protein n=1 Tax=Arthrobacter sp. YAF34 TaxID=3233083 RepID=UPI003F93BA06
MSKDVLSERINSADPALEITEAEFARSRAKSLLFMDSEVTHIAVGGSISEFHRPPAKRHWGRLSGVGIAAAAVAAVVVTSVLTASALQTPPAETAATAASPTANVQALSSGPMRDLFAAADEVLVLQALPNNRAWNKAYEEFMASPDNLGKKMPGLGTEPINVLQVLKGSRTVGKSTLDVASAPDSWKDTNTVTPLTFLAFAARGNDGKMHLMGQPKALLEIQNLRRPTLADPVTHKPVDVGAELLSRINAAPTGDTRIATYPAAPPVAAGNDVIREDKKNTDGTSEGTIHGRLGAGEACFTFQTSKETVYLRWPAGYTAATRSLPQNSDGSFSIDGSSRGDRPVVLNDWGTIYAYDGDPRPLITGTRTTEKASCGSESLPVFDVTPPWPGASPFGKNPQGGPALP